MQRLTFIIAFLLLLALTVLNNYVSRCLAASVLLGIVVFWMTGDVYRSVIVAVFAWILMYMLRPQLGEGFDDKGDDKMTKIIDELNSLADKDKEAEADSNIAVEKSGEEIDEKETENLFKNDEDDKEKDIPDLSSQYIAKMTPAQAQKETFRLINTLKQLDDTIQNMAPTLKQGAKIIEKFKKLNIGA